MDPEPKNSREFAAMMERVRDGNPAAINRLDAMSIEQIDAVTKVTPPVAAGGAA
jgi:hypothetical protein